MEAAKHNRADSLVLLLQPLLHLSMEMDEDMRLTLDRVLHARNRDGHTLLYLVAHHQRNLFLAHSMIVHLEYLCHGCDQSEIQECVKRNLGSSKMSKETVQVIDVASL